MPKMKNKIASSLEYVKFSPINIIPKKKIIIK